MRDILLFAVILILRLPVFSQTDPDSLITEWLSSTEWEGLSLHPDIAADWLLGIDSTLTDTDSLTYSVSHLATLTIPTGADPFGWVADTGAVISPLSARYRLRIRDARRWEFRFQANQAAGDTCFRVPATGLPPGFSGSFRLKPARFFNEVIIGDFQVSSGFGAVTGTSPLFSLALGNPSSLARTGMGIRLHSGSTSGRFLRGIGVSMPFGRTELVLFGSGKGAVQEEVAGLNLKRSFPGAEFGVTVIRIGSQLPIAEKEGWASAWQPRKGAYGRTGAWGQVRVPFGIVFGELGWSPPGGFGWVGGVRWFEAHGFSAVVKTSGCSPGYPVICSMFQSGTGLTRESRKVTAAFRFAPARTIEWVGTAEVSSQSWPATGSRFGNASTRISHQVKITSKNRWSLTGSVQVDFQEVTGDVPGKVTWRLAFDSDPKMTGTVRLRAGIRQQYQGFGDLVTRGSTAECSSSLLLAKRKLMVTAGFRIFSVETGADPLYAYEQDILGGFSAPVLTGSGTRWFATVRWKISEKTSVEFKAGQTAYTDVKHFQEGGGGGLSGKVQVYVRL